MRQSSFATAARLVAWLAAAPCFGQFDTVLNLPPDPDLQDFVQVDSNTQVNLFNGGMIGFGVRFGNDQGTASNIELNILGGNASRPELYAGTTTNISGGNISMLDLYDADSLSISGGTINALYFNEGVTPITISGGQIDFVRYDPFFSDVLDHDLTITAGTILGSPRIGFYEPGFTVLSNQGDFTMSGGQVLGGDALIVAKGVTLTGGIVEGTVDTTGGTGLLDGADIYFAGALEGGTFNLNSGFAGAASVSYGGVVNVNATVGLGDLQFFGDGAVNFNGGEHTVNEVVLFRTFDQNESHTQQLNINAGTLTIDRITRLASQAGLILNVSGGELTLQRTSPPPFREINVSGGIFTAGFGTFRLPTPKLKITGGNFGGGVSILSHGIDYAGHELLGGTIGDSVSFEFINAQPDHFIRVDGSAIGDFARFDIAVQMSSGSVGTASTFDGGLTMDGGSVGDLTFFRDLTMTGGSVGNDAELWGDLTLKGGQIGDRFSAEHFDATVQIFGSQFILNGVDISASMQFGDTLIINDRNVELIGILEDGNAFDFFLGTDEFADQDYFRPGATEISVTLSTLFGDFDNDLDVDNKDIGWLIGNFTGDGASDAMRYTDGDLDGDGDVDAVDLDQLIDRFTGTDGLGPTTAQLDQLSQLRASAAAVPEPTTAALLLASGFVFIRRRRSD